MRVKELRALLSDLPDEATVVLSRDAGPSGWRIAGEVSRGFYVVTGEIWGEFYDADQGEDELAGDSHYIEAVCIWPKEQSDNLRRQRLP